MYKNKKVSKLYDAKISMSYSSALINFLKKYDKHEKKKIKSDRNIRFYYS